MTDFMGDMMGYGDELEGEDMSVLGATVQRRGGLMRLPARPAWRQGGIAPGVWGPKVGLVPLPMRPDSGTIVFSLTQQFTTYRGKPQKPFRAERLLVSIAKTGASALGNIVLAQGIFVGTTPGLAELGEFSLEEYTRDAVGVRLALQGATPGIEITIPVRTATPLTGTDTILVTLQFLGQSVG